MKIIPDSNYQKIYTGSNIKATYLKTLLEDYGINPILRNDEESALAGGFGMDYANGVKILVRKKDVLKAKHTVQGALDEHGDIIAISEDELEKQALSTTENIFEPARKSTQYKRSPLNIIINVGLIVFSLWKLSPLFRGEDLPTFRLVISGGIILFCSWALINHFKR